MLLQLDKITAATKLTAADVVGALKRNGYDDAFQDAPTFMGMTVNGSFVYAIDFMDIDTGTKETGMVYVYFNDKGEYLADY